MEHMTIGQLINALLDIPADQHGQRVTVMNYDGTYAGGVLTAGQYDMDEPCDEDNPFWLEIGEEED